MKYIIKNSEPKELQEWKDKKNESWQPNWNNFQKPEKDIVLKSLIEEQGFICCYCNRELKPENEEVVIEHNKPRSNCSEEEKIDYLNMLASCDGILKKGDRKYIPKEDHCCDRYRGNKEVISPLDPLCESYFKYNWSGEIIGESEKASQTIKYLNLNIDDLKKDRRDTIEGFLFVDENEIVTEEEAKKIKEELLNAKSSSGKFKPFCMAVVGIILNEFPSLA